jgi:hypothetical protein
MFTCNGQRFETVAIARRVAVDGWTHVPAAAPDTDGNVVGGCNWMVHYVPEPMYCEETGDVDYWDDPELPIRDCGAEVAYSDHRWECAAGHEHTSAEERERLGFDYAEDDYDAAVIARGGRRPVPMGPNTHIDERHAAQIMATL